jgi:hypothetical protein
MRLISLSLSLFLAAAPALADSSAPSASVPETGAVTEIRLGKAPSPPPPVDPARVRAVERFLAARQDASAARAMGERPALGVPAPKGAKAEDLYGPDGAWIVAFDFQDASIEPAGSGRFTVAAYLLFADKTGQVVESRDERLAFAGAGGSWSCTSIRTTSGMTWESASLQEIAASQGAAEELQKARAHLREWSATRDRSRSYSLADVAKDRDGRVRVPCLRFTAGSGRRGFEVDQRPIVLSRTRGAVQLETH